MRIKRERMDNAYRKICLINEVDTSVKLLKKGMSELQSINGANDFYYVPFLLLSSGYERLIKCLLCLASMDKNGKIKKLPFKKTHDLIGLLDKLLSVCKQKNYSSKFPDAKKDIDMLSNDKHLRNIISILSEFAQSSRYYNLDIVLKGKSKYKDPKAAWEEEELNIFQNKEDFLKRLNKENLDDIYKEINRKFIVSLEKFTRALARLFTLADFGDFAKQVSSVVYGYLTLRDEELGTRDYRDSEKRGK
jgi:hypothetical protein